MISWLSKLFKRFHKHKWQTRGQNRWGSATYRVCLSCRVRQKRVNNSWEDERWEDCAPIGYLDEQFDEFDNFIWK